MLQGEISKVNDRNAENYSKIRYRNGRVVVGEDDVKKSVNIEEWVITNIIIIYYLLMSITQLIINMCDFDDTKGGNYFERASKVDWNRMHEIKFKTGMVASKYEVILKMIKNLVSK